VGDVHLPASSPSRAGACRDKVNSIAPRVEKIAASERLR
jgi:hypothetical protein